MAEEQESNKKKSGKSRLFWTLIIILVFVAGLVIGGAAGHSLASRGLMKGHRGQAMRGQMMNYNRGQEGGNCNCNGQCGNNQPANNNQPDNANQPNNTDQPSFHNDADKTIPTIQ